MNRKPYLTHLIASILLAVHAYLVLDLIPRWSPTYNEPGHIIAGLAYWATGTFDFYRVNPPFPKMVATLLLLNDSDVDRAAINAIPSETTIRSEVEVGRYFVATNSRSFHRILCKARLAGVFWVTLGGFYIWLWSSHLFGDLAGLLSLSLWTLEPTVTAHSALATPDMPATVLGLATAYYMTRSSESWTYTLVAGLFLGLSLLSKFTLLLLIPSWAATLIVPLIFNRAFRRTRLQTGVILQLTKMGVVATLALYILNSGYAFDGSCSRFASDGFHSKSLRSCCGVLEMVGIRLPIPVPRAYVYGMDEQKADFEGGMRSYLRGEWRSRGWWYYYVYAFAVKAPLGHLVIYALSLLCISADRWGKCPLLWLFPVVVFSGASIMDGFTNHLRYILPAFPFMMVMTGGVASAADFTRRVPRCALVLLVVLSLIVTNVRAYPHLLSYFNECVGGNANGWLHLADSNCDWGQDWIYLREWLADHPQLDVVAVALMNHIDSHAYLGKSYPLPTVEMNGYAVVDSFHLTQDYAWLQRYALVARIGSSLFVFDVRRSASGR